MTTATTMKSASRVTAPATTTEKPAASATSKPTSKRSNRKTKTAQNRRKGKTKLERRAIAYGYLARLMDGCDSVAMFGFPDFYVSPELSHVLKGAAAALRNEIEGWGVRVARDHMPAVQRLDL